jgi:type IV pilus assembly protein PilA
MMFQVSEPVAHYRRKRDSGDKRREASLETVYQFRLRSRHHLHWREVQRPALADVSNESGFTLIELMIVLLILAILLAVAIPTFLGTTKSANDRAAQSNLNTALINAKTVFQANSQSYALGTPGTANLTTNNSSLVSTLTTIQPSLSFVTGTVIGGLSPSTVSVSIAADGNGLVLAEQAKGTQNCWFVVDNVAGETAASGGTSYTSITGAALGGGTYYGEQKYSGTGVVPACSALAAPAPAAGSVAYQSSGFPSL